MQHKIDYGPSFALLKVQLDPGDRIIAEAGAMVTRDSNLRMETKLNAGTKSGFFGKIWAFFIALVRKLIGGETMFINTFYPKTGSGTVTLAPSLAGHIVHRKLENERILLQAGAFLACSPGVDMKLRWGGLRGILAKEGIVFIECFGTGDLFMTAYGGIQEVEVDGSFIVDNGHMVAFTSGLDFKIKSAGGGMLGLFASGEGLVIEFQGKGKVYIQSRNLGALVEWLVRLLP